MSANIDDQIEYAERLFITAGKATEPHSRVVVRQMDRDKRCIEAIIETLKLTKTENYDSETDYAETVDALESTQDALKAIKQQAEQLKSLPGISALSKEMAAVEKIIDLANGDE